MRSIVIFILTLSVIGLPTGCSRTRYRTAADRDAYRIVQEKSACLTERLQKNYTVRPDPRSRFYDPTNPDCPQLPVPRTILNGYAFPSLASDVSQIGADSSPRDPSSLRLIEVTGNTDRQNKEPQPQVQVVPDQSSIVQASFHAETVRLLSDDNNPVSGNKPEKPEPIARPNNGAINKVTIPPQAWEVLPKNCLDRMLEFETLKQEYSQSFADFKIDSSDSSIRRLTLANLMELASINSREYQARKEVLFRSALTLTRQRYQYDLNPSPFGNGTAANYRHLRTNGVTDNRLATPSGIGIEKTLATGGQFLARFANSVILTFNGPSGFAADVGSEMIFDFQQTVFQRDVRFENLTRSEREVIYATRDYIRFRKQLFRDIATQYYNLLLNFRTIEINAQDYFTNLRGFIQSQAEYRTAEKIPRIQVDQFEQNVLRTRSNLVNNSFALEAALDQLKFRLGIPTEMTIYMDLTELESISLKDELSVARQMITRARMEVLSARKASILDATTLANVAEVLAERISNILRIQKRMDQATGNTNALPPSRAEETNNVNESNNQAFEKAAKELEQLQQLLQILGVRMQVDTLRLELDAQLKTETPAPPLRVLIRAIEFCSSEMQVIDLALASTQASARQKQTEALRKRQSELEEKLGSLKNFLEEISSNLGSESVLSGWEGFAKIPARMKESVKLVEQMEALARDSTIDILPAEGKSIESKVQSTVDTTIELSDRLLEKGPDGWEEIVIGHDEALLTGLVQRLDLMNQRGALADGWRQIKLAGDDLRSIVDLRATQILRTNSSGNAPLDFSFDDSETRMSIALDTPLNRRLQRNNFRLALINYNVGLRNLMAAEDSIKLDVREDLRQLALDRNQYTIAVAGAALAYERVISTRLRLQFGVANVAARDFLEAQQAYTNALSAIARQHVNYITDRTELFFDLEAIDVDSNGYWSGVQEDFGPQINVDFPGTNPRPYDNLPPRVWYSKSIRQMEQIPPGDAIVVPPRLR
ncbi:MAG TPA: TolC family protein [Pirellula sp.]|nr:TolC family protein [Pirellula sp.]